MSGDGRYGYHKVFYLNKDSQVFIKAYRLRAIHGDAPFKVYDAPVPESLFILTILYTYKYIISFLYLETNKYPTKLLFRAKCVMGMCDPTSFDSELHRTRCGTF